MNKVQVQGDLEVPVKENSGQFSYLKIKRPTEPEPEIASQEPEDSTPKFDPGRKSSSENAPAVSQVQRQASAPAAAPKAAYYIDAQDELEVDSFRGPDRGQQDQIKSRTLEDEAESLRQKIVPELKPGLKRQFNKVIASFWREVRSSLEMREVLTRDASMGGLALSESQVDGVIKKAQAEQDQVSQKLASGVLQEKANGAPRESGSAPEDILEFDEKPEVFRSSAAQINVAKSSVLRSQLLGSQQKLSTELKPRMESIKKTESIQPRVRAAAQRIRPVGPIEELGNMNLEEFRRLSKKPSEAAQKIYQKADILGDESIELKAKGIASWRGSPLYRMYLKLGRGSMDSEKSVDQLALENPTDANSLSIEEFHAIADLNRSLRF